MKTLKQRIFDACCVCVNSGAANELYNLVIKGLASRLNYRKVNNVRKRSYWNTVKMENNLEEGNFKVGEWLILAECLETTVDSLMRPEIKLDSDKVLNFSTLYYIEPINLAS